VIHGTGPAVDTAAAGAGVVGLLAPDAPLAHHLGAPRGLEPGASDDDLDAYIRATLAPIIPWGWRAWVSRPVTW
jgi:hypothetical protein